MNSKLLFVACLLYLALGPSPINASSPLDLLISIVVLIIEVVLNVLYTFVLPLATNPMVHVETHLGTIRGMVEKTSLNQTYYAFKSVPYVEPPERWEIAKDKKPWPGVIDAREEGKVCYQIGVDPISMSEDCLTISISTPQLPTPDNPEPNLPVLFFIYGGAFVAGSNRPSEYSPDYLLSENIVIVQVNYRLNIFGFVSDGNEIPKNLGVKDCIKGLNFTRSIIKKFGGDPEQITLNGQSAGAAIAGYILQSPQVENDRMFDKVIMQSGSNLAPWAFQKDPGLAFSIMYMGTGVCPLLVTMSILDKVNCMKLVPAYLLGMESSGIDVLHALIFLQFFQGPLATVFLEDPSEEYAAVTKWQHEAFANGDFRKDVKLMIGITAEEVLIFQYFMEIYRLYGDLYPKILVPQGLQPIPEDLTTKVIPAIKSHYFGSNPVLVANSRDLIRYGSDVLINNNFREFLTVAAPHLDEVYCYQFSYKSAIGVSWTYAQGTGEVSHMEDQCMLWKLYNWSLEPLRKALITEQDWIVRFRLVKLWANFIKTGSPTPTMDPGLQNFTWPLAPQGGTNMTCVNIAADLTIIENPKEDSYQMWRKLYLLYGELKGTF